MDEQIIDLGIKFMRGYEPAPPVPGGSTDVASGLAQTGDFNIALIAGLLLLACAVVGFCAYSFIKNKQLVSGAHTSNSASSIFNLSNLSLRAKIISAIVTLLAIVCIICGCFSMNAHAADGEGPIVVTPNTISAVVSEDGQISSWDPTNVTLTNTSTTDKFDIKSCKVALTNKAKSVEALANATIKITGFGGKVVFEGKATDSEVACTGLSLDKSGLTTLAFEITGTFDIAQLESLYDKQLFKISLNIEKSLPMYDNLYDYTLDELQQVSAYLAENYDETVTYPEGDIRKKFRDFRDNGLTADGSDNGVAMKAEFKNHWAIDKNNKLFKDSGFVNDKTTIQARIIGICEDYVDKEHTQKIGLTFMTTHALNTPTPEGKKYNDGNATYGWAGSTASGQCTLQSFLNPNIATDSPFPNDLVATVKTAAKGYQYSNDESTEQPIGNSIATNKFWAPSMEELYGDDTTHPSEWWPKKNEGDQYSLFENKGIKSESGYSCFTNIDKVQDDSLVRRTGFVWSRSLCQGRATFACGVDGYRGGQPISFELNYERGVVSCFCI